MSKILCVYYSRTGKTEGLMQEIARELGCEAVKLEDGRDRSGLAGWLYSGMQAMSRKVTPVQKPETALPLSEYDLVILGTPVWAGRCSSIAREFLKKYGKSCRKMAYVITRQDEKNKYEQVFEQMDLYTAHPRLCAVSLRGGDVGEPFWREEFIKEVRRSLEKE